MFSLAWQAIKARKAGFIAPFLAIFGGAILLTGCGILMESSLFGGTPVQRLTAAPVVVAGNQSVTVATTDENPNERTEMLTEKVMVDRKVVDDVSRIPGVTKAIGEVSFPVSVGSHESFGHGWGSAALTPYVLQSGQAPAGPRDVVLDADLAQRSGLSVGGSVDVITRAKAQSYHVVGLLKPAAQSAVFFTDDVARTLSGTPDKFAAIGVFGDGRDLADRVANALAGNDNVTVLSGVDRSEAESADGAQSRQILTIISGSFSGFVLMIVIFVTGSTLALVLNQRRREFALLRAIAATPRQLRRLIGAEAFVVSILGALLGVVPGLIGAYALRDVFAAIGVIPDDFELSISPIPMAAAVLLCVLAAQIAARSSARRMLKVKPVEALGEAAVEKGKLGRARLAVGSVILLAATGGAVSTLVIPGHIAILPAGMSAMFAVLGIGMLGPVMMAKATRLIGGRLLRSGNSAWYLAARNSMANSRRLAAAVTPLVLTIGFAVSQFYSQTTFADASSYQAREATKADFVLTAPHGLPAEAADAARAVPGVTAATSLISSNVVVVDPDAVSEPISPSKAYGVDASQLNGTLSLTASSGQLSHLRGDTVALSESEASWQSKKVGDRVEMYLGDRTRITPQVIAIFENNLGYGDVLLPQDVLMPHVTSHTASSILISGPPSVHSGLAALAGRFPGLSVADKQALAFAADNQEQANMWLNRILLGVILLYVALSVVNTLVTATLDRGRELSLLRLVGGTRRQVLRIMRAESWIVVGIAVLIGSVISVLPLVFLSLNLTGSPLPTGSPLVYPAIVLATVLIGLVGIRLPARRLAKAHLGVLTRD